MVGDIFIQSNPPKKLKKASYGPEKVHIELETYFVVKCRKPETLSGRLKEVLLDLIYSQQKWDVKNRHICKSKDSSFLGKSKRLASDVIKISKTKKTF